MMEKTVNKSTTPKTNAEGYELVLSKFGPRHGAKTKLGKELGGITRQTVDRWQKHGIPPKYWPQIKELTGLTPQQHSPENF